MKTDTPRCEAARFEALRSSALRTDCIPLKLGEELERELTEAQALNNKLVKELGATRASLSNYTRVIETL
jgi:hypothetical protein